jgi:hypothetical protein
MTGTIYYSSLKIETSGSSGTLETFYRDTRHYIPEDSTLYIQWHANPKSNLTWEVFLQNKWLIFRNIAVACFDISDRLGHCLAWQ